MEEAERYRRLAAFFANPDPGDPAPAPADLGDPAAYNGDAWIVRAALRGDDPDTIYELLSPDDKARIAAQGVGADLRERIRQALAERWQVLGAADLLRPPRRPEYLIADMVRCPGLVCLYGAPGDLKSMLLMDLAVCVAAGLPWMVPLPDVGKGGAYQVKQGAVLWLDMDNGSNRLQERFGALCRARGVTDAPLHAISLPRPVYDASDMAEADLLAEQIRELGAVLCVVDNLGTVSSGRDENSSEMVDVMANLRWVAESTGATLFVIHHARKGTAQSGGREGDRLRGHSSIEASLDLSLMVERVEDDLTIGSTKTRDDPVRPFLARWTYEKTLEGALGEGRFWHVEQLQPKLPAYAQVARDLADLIAGMDTAPNQSELVKAVGEAYELGRKAALDAIRYAVSHGWVREQKPLHKGIGAAVRYYVP